mmetsp:Transcript_54358/g.116069  ORF Transcript_54358/g.116069 Transcript_54358/m.116069 type:complete len:288 (-) Transcript_54358:964-1827(-)
MHVPLLGHEPELVLGEAGIYQGKWQTMEGQIPRSVPRELPLVWHGDDVAIRHVVPITVSDGASLLWRLRAVFVAFEKGEDVIVVELLRPDHTSQGLPLNAFVLFVLDVALQACVELIGFVTAGLHDGVEGAEWILASFGRLQHSFDDLGATCRDDSLQNECCLCSSRGLSCAPVALDHIAVEGILVWASTDLAARMVKLRRAGGRRKCESLLTRVPITVETGVHGIHVVSSSRREVLLVVFSEREGRWRSRRGVLVLAEIERPQVIIGAFDCFHIRLVVANKDSLCT